VADALDNLITKHPKVMSTVSTILITMGSIVLFPGFTACASGTILAHPAVSVAGAVAVAIGKWFRTALNSATARLPPKMPICSRKYEWSSMRPERDHLLLLGLLFDQSM
jgi:hypothetical protein